MSSQVHVVLMKPSGDLVQRSAPFDEVIGSGAIEGAIKSGLQAIAVFVERDAPGGPFWEEFSGHESFACQATFEGVAVCQLDTQGQDTAEIQEFLLEGSMRPKRVVQDGVAGVMMGRGPVWDTFDGGNSSEYDTKLVEARQLVGFPGS